MESISSTTGNRRLLKIWTPEDQAFWKREGQAIASRNLWISAPSLFLAFAIWQLFSVIAVQLPQLGFKYTQNELFMLTAAPSLLGATLRIFYSFVVPIFGGRRWTALSTASLLVPALGIGLAVQNPATPYWVMLTLALLCGFGSGNFSSSMANISFFFPKERKGSALGVNAGLGNLGVSSLQFLAPLVVVIGIFGPFAGEPRMVTNLNGDRVHFWAQNVAFIWIPFIILFALAAWFFMNDIADARASIKEQRVIFKRKHNWLMCWLYLGTFGSFIGYSAGFPLLIKSQFPQINPLQYAWLGPFLGAIIRPFGGWLADRIGGARVTFWVFTAMALAVPGVLHFLPGGGNAGNFTGFMSMFLLLFLASGIGNGSTFRMIPVIFMTQHMRAAQHKSAAAQEAALKTANMESAAVIGFTAALAAYGGFFIPKSFGTSVALTGGPQAALYGFIAFYISCLALTWWCYARKNAPMPC
jgi:MFS transporter, NNP family, nitrate/nitrite transporter